MGMGRIYTLDRSGAAAPGFYDDHEWGVPVGTPYAAAGPLGSVALMPTRANQLPEQPVSPSAVTVLQQKIEAGKLPPAVFLD